MIELKIQGDDSFFFFFLNNSCKICCQDHCFTDDDGRKQLQEVVKCDIKRWLLV